MTHTNSTPANPVQVTDALETLLNDVRHWLHTAYGTSKPSWALPSITTAEAALTAAIGAGGQAVAAFGDGKLVVTQGTVDGKPAVFIAPAKTPGEVGTSAKRENTPKDRLIAGEWYMTFPTEEQASLVADAMCNALSQPHPADERVVEALNGALKEIDNVTGISDQDANCLGRAENLIRQALSALSSAPATADGWRTKAADDVLAERKRQVEAEGWTPEHDDAHGQSEMATAAACYALATTDFKREALWEIWPKEWGVAWFKPTTNRRNLVKAGALILAEIERLDRLPAAPTATGGRG